jgi:hypothetical protein
MAEEIKFTVGAPVSQSAIPSYKRGSKYAELFAAVEALKPDQWLPVTVGTERQGQRLVEVAKLRGFRRKRRGLVVYIARKEADSDNSNTAGAGQPVPGSTG